MSIERPPAAPDGKAVEEEMLIDCSQCSGQKTGACGDCVVMYLLRDLPGPIEVEEEQAVALGILAECGLVPQLRLAPRAVETVETAGAAVAAAVGRR